MVTDALLAVDRNSLQNWMKDHFLNPSVVYRLRHAKSRYVLREILARASSDAGTAPYRNRHDTARQYFQEKFSRFRSQIQGGAILEEKTETTQALRDQDSGSSLRRLRQVTISPADEA